MLKKIKTRYYYLFYKLYKFWDYVSIPKFWTDFKAGISIIALEIWFLGSIGFYYCLLTNTKPNISLIDPIIFIPLILIIGLNHFFFNMSGEWKYYIKYFDQLPKKKNIIGGIIVWMIIITIIVNFFVSAYFFQKRVLGL